MDVWGCEAESCILGILLLIGDASLVGVWGLGMVGPGCFLMVALERRFGDILAVWLRCDRRCCIEYGFWGKRLGLALCAGAGVGCFLEVSLSCRREVVLMIFVFWRRCRALVNRSACVLVSIQDEY